MKSAKHITAALFAATLAMSSCTSPLEQQLMGSWLLSDSQISRLDSICKVRSAEAVASTKKAIEQVQHELDSTKSNEKRTELKNFQNKLKADMESYTPETFKNEYEELTKKQIGELSINFLANNQIQIHAFDAEEIQTGTWRVSGDTIHTLFDNQPAEILIVKKITTSQLELFSPALDEKSVDLTLKLEKK